MGAPSEEISMAPAAATLPTQLGANTISSRAGGCRAGPDGKDAVKLSFAIATGCPGPEKKDLFSDNWPYDWIGGSLHCPRPSLTLMVIEGLANVCEANTGTAQPLRVEEGT